MFVVLLVLNLFVFSKKTTCGKLQLRATPPPSSAVKLRQSSPECRPVNTSWRNNLWSLTIVFFTSTCTEQWAFAVPLTLCVLHFVFRISVLLMGCWSVLANSITSDYCVTITHMFYVIMIWYWGIWCLDKFTKIGSQVKSLTFGSTQLSYWLLKQIRIALHVSSTLDNECFNLVPKVGIL